MYLSNIIKPTHICNLGCKYCYNEDTRDPIMSYETLENIVSKSFDFISKLAGFGYIEFVWHGGEPMVAKLKFYEKVVELQKKYNRGLAYTNTMQTNGTLINDQWVEFLKKNNFKVSISIDGPKKVNDKVRNYSSGKSSFQKVLDGINKVKEAKIPLGIAVVISKANKNNVDEIYDFLLENKLKFNIIPLNRSGDAVNNFIDLGLESEEYAEPWIKMYDKWFFSNKQNYIDCSDFIFKTSAILSGQPKDCVGMQNCSKHMISIDPDGFVYPCATFSSDAYWNYGNINEKNLKELFESNAAKKASNRKEDEHCKSCKWKHVCYGGCFSRSYKFYGTENTRDYYCPSLYSIYEHVEKRLRSLKNINLDKLPGIDFGTDCREAPKERNLIDKTFVRPHKIKKSNSATI